MTHPEHRDPRNDPLLDSLPEAEGYKVLDGRFVLYDVLGKGGMGVVYRGEHLGLGIDVAVKCLDPALARHDPQFVVRFEKEARAAARIDDPNVVRVHDVSQDSGLHYIVMQYVAGENGRQRVERKGPLAVEEAVTVAMGAARGLAAAHSAGLVHRDVKPDNVLVSADGEVKLADLGLSKMEGDQSMTYTGAAMGTPRYMPPEQYKDAKNVGPRADVYSLGATLYFLLVGSDAIDGKTPPEVMMQVCSGEFPRVMAKRPGIPPEVDELVARWTSLDPADRPASGTEMVEQLKALGVSVENLREDQENMTLLGVSQVSPPPMQTLMRIQAGMSEARTQARTQAKRKAQESEAAGAAGAAGAAAAGVAGAAVGPDTPAAVEPQQDDRSSSLAWVLGILLLLTVVWLLWREFGPSPSDTPTHQPLDVQQVDAPGSSDPPAEGTTTPAQVLQAEEVAEPELPEVVPLPPVALKLTRPESPGQLWVSNQGVIQVQGQVSGARTEVVTLTIDGGVPSVFSLDDEGRFAFDRVVQSGTPQRFSLTAEGLAAAVAFDVVKDDVPPVITIVSPRPGARVTRAESMDIELMVEDAHLDRVMVGSQVLQLQSDGRGVARGVPLMRPGDNVLVVTATDLAGLSTEEALTIVRDRKPPTVVSVDPAPGARVLAGSTLEFKLTVDDRNASVTVDGSRLTVADGAPGGAVARGQFSAPMTPGPWSLEHVVCDKLGNCSTDSVEYLVFEEPPVVVQDDAVLGPAADATPDPIAEAPSALSDMVYVGENAQGLAEYDLDLGGVNMRFVSLPAGTFTMGSPDRESFRQDDEGPRHSVSLGPFLIAKYECTQAQWRAVMESSPAHNTGDNLPVEQVSLAECEQFAAAHDLAVPSEAQWEYAVRAGTEGPSYVGLARCAWYSNQSDGVSHPVGELEANAFGLHDMLGNVSELCADSQHRDYSGAPTDGSVWIDAKPKRRMRRGGNFTTDHKGTRAACRRSVAHENFRSYDLGFRPVRGL